MKVYKIIQNILVAAAIILLVIAVVCILCRIKPCIVMSGSMEPDITTGSICFINCRDKVPEAGDIICYKKGELSITHRVVTITDEGYVTKGDNNESNDPGTIKQNQIKGTYLFMIPYIGYVVDFMRSSRGIIILTTIIGCFILMGIYFEQQARKGKRNE